MPNDTAEQPRLDADYFHLRLGRLTTTVDLLVTQSNQYRERLGELAPFKQRAEDLEIDNAQLRSRVAELEQIIDDLTDDDSD